jgi:hypothetical protein
MGGLQRFKATFLCDVTFSWKLTHSINIFKKQKVTMLCIMKYRMVTIFFLIPSNIECNFVMDEVSANDPTITYQSLHITFSINIDEFEMINCRKIKRFFF